MMESKAGSELKVLQNDKVLIRRRVGVEGWVSKTLDLRQLFVSLFNLTVNVFFNRDLNEETELACLIISHKPFSNRCTFVCVWCGLFSFVNKYTFGALLSIYGSRTLWMSDALKINNSAQVYRGKGTCQPVQLCGSLVCF